MKRPIRAIIVDDEKHSREILRSLLALSFPQLIIQGEADSASQASQLIAAHRPDLVFLDIQMPRASGFSLLKGYDTIPFETIFVTSYDNYAITAIRFSALDYLLKPIELSELQSAVAKAILAIEQKRNSSIQVINLLHGMDENTSEKKVAVHHGDQVSLISTTEILYIRSTGRYCELQLRSGQSHLVPKYLKDFETYLGSSSTIIRVHKASMVNTAHIQAYSKGEPCILTMADGQSFEVSRRKKQEILELIKQRPGTG